MRLSSPSSPIPDNHNHVTLFVCLACQRGCPECSQRGLRQWKPDYQMSLEEVKWFVECTKQSNYPQFKSIIVSGGEPLLWNHLEEGVKLLKESGLAKAVNVFSNGLNTDAVTPGLMENVSTLRLSRYEENVNVLASILSKYGKDKVNIVDRTRHTPIPQKALWDVTPAKCGCEGYGLCDGIMYACPMVPAVSMELGWNVYEEASCPIQVHWAEQLADFDRANHDLCRACIGNHRVRHKMARAV